jgi:hypothetical protein
MWSHSKPNIQWRPAEFVLVSFFVHHTMSRMPEIACFHMTQRVVYFTLLSCGISALCSIQFCLLAEALATIL